MPNTSMTVREYSQAAKYHSVFIHKYICPTKSGYTTVRVVSNADSFKTADYRRVKVWVRISVKPRLIRTMTRCRSNGVWREISVRTPSVNIRDAQSADYTNLKHSQNNSFSFSSRCHRSAREGRYALRPVSQQSPQGCSRNTANVCLVGHRSVPTSEGGMSSASFLHPAFRQAINAVMF